MVQSRSANRSAGRTATRAVQRPGVRARRGGPIIPGSILKALKELPENKLHVVLDFGECVKLGAQGKERFNISAVRGGPILGAIFDALAELPEEKLRHVINTSASLSRQIVDAPVITAAIGGPIVKASVRFS